MTIEDKLNWLKDNCPEEAIIHNNNVYIIDSLWGESGVWCYVSFNFNSLNENLNKAIDWSKKTILERTKIV